MKPKTGTSVNLDHAYARLRACVAYLGQKDVSGWWKCSFMNDNGRAIAQYNFPRNAAFSTLTATCEAAKRLHDERIGRRQCVHLFRMPLHDEIGIQQVWRSAGSDPAGMIPSRRDEAIQGIAAICDEIITVEAGPVQVGSRNDALSAHGLNELAKHYLAAFRQDVTCLPYFSDAKR